MYKLHFYTILFLSSVHFSKLYSQKVINSDAFNPILWKKEVPSLNRSDIKDHLNFHPTLLFKDNNGGYVVPLSETKKLTIFSVYNSHSGGGLGSVEGDTYNVSFNESDITSINKVAIGTTKNVPKLLCYSEYFDETKISFDLNKTAYFNIGESIGKNDKNFIGNIGELIVFDKVLNKNEKQKIITYLSIKYGISMVDTFSYMDSHGKSIAEKKAGFHHRFTGIGKDDYFMLNQKQSHNGYDNACDFTIGLGGIWNTNDENKSNIPNLAYMTWTDDGHDGRWAQYTNGQFLDRKWLIKSNHDFFVNKQFEVSILKNKLLDYNEKMPVWMIVLHQDKTEEVVKMKRMNDTNVFFDYTFDKDLSGSDEVVFAQSFRHPITTEFLEASEDRIYPNPVAVGQEFMLSLSNLNDSEINISLFDLNGKMLTDEKREATNKSFLYNSKIPVEGQYILKVSGENTSKQFKIIAIKN
jgi:Secretion system C-terminal sorting domain